MANNRQYLYTKGADPALDSEFAAAAAYGKIKPAATGLFWKSGLRWYRIPLDSVQRIFRRVEPVYGKMCCGRQTFIIEWLVLVLTDGTELVLHIGDDVKKQAEDLMLFLKETHPQIQYGKHCD